MLWRWSARLILTCLVSLLLISAGCEKLVPPENAGPIEAAQPDDESADDPIIPGNGPIRRDDKPLKTPMFEGLKRQIEQAPVSGDSESIVRDLSDQLSDADALYSEAKRRNRSAIQQANRQVRIGAAKRSPNLVLITVDRLGIGDLSCRGQTLWQTPQIDQLARSGMTFSNYYAGAGHSQAGRQTLLTGRFATQNPPSRSASLLPRTLWSAGYKTALIGDLSSSEGPLGSQGYEDWSGWNSPTNEYPDWAEINGRRITLEDNLNGNHRVRTVDFLLSEVRSIAQECGSRGNPFFLHVTHRPFSEKRWLTVTSAEYEQSIRSADELVGGVLNLLHELGLTGQTCVFFTADAGPHPALSALVRETRSTGAYSFSEDGLSEGNLRVPCIVSWPREVSSESASDQIVGAWDLFPTMIDLAAVNRSVSRMDGQTLAAHWRQKPPTAERRFVWRSESRRDALAVRSGKWKVLKQSASKYELFDLDTDPAEQKNLAEMEPDVLKRLLSVETIPAIPR